MTADGATRFWRAVSRLPVDRALGLRELEICFAAGTPPDALDGRLRGRLLAMTIGPGFDLPAEAVTKLWMPWRGKTFDRATGTGRNDFTVAAGRLMRMTLRRYPQLRVNGSSSSAFVFRTSIGRSALDDDTEVLRIDYRDVPENPSWPIRRVLDELVAVDDGLYLGQALLERRGRLRRAAWFSLEGNASQW
jgi:hypothetical protein